MYIVGSIEPAFLLGGSYSLIIKEHSEKPEKHRDFLMLNYSIIQHSYKNITFIEGRTTVKIPFIKLFRTPNSSYFLDVNKNEFVPISATSFQYLSALMSGKGNCAYGKLRQYLLFKEIPAFYAAQTRSTEAEGGKTA